MYQNGVWRPYVYFVQLINPNFYSDIIKQCGLAGTCAIVPNCVECATDLCNGDMTPVIDSAAKIRFWHLMPMWHLIRIGMPADCNKCKDSCNGAIIASMPYAAVWLFIGSSFMDWIPYGIQRYCQSCCFPMSTH